MMMRDWRQRQFCSCFLYVHPGCFTQRLLTYCMSTWKGRAKTHRRTYAHAPTQRSYTPVKLSAATGTFHLGRLYLAALLPRSVRPHDPHSSSLYSPLLSLSSFLVPCRLFSPSLMICSFFVIRSFGRHEICSIYHISLARRKSINSSIAFLKKGGKKGLKPRNNCTGLCSLRFLLLYELSKLWRSSEGKWEKARVLSEQTWLAGL